MLSGVFHAWERKLASAATDRVVRPFEWGLEWVDGQIAASPGDHLETWAERMVKASDEFYALPPTTDQSAGMTSSHRAIRQTPRSRMPMVKIVVGHGARPKPYSKTSALNRPSSMSVRAIPPTSSPAEV